MKNTKNPSAWAKCTPNFFADLVFADDYTQKDLHDYVQYPQMCGNIILEGGFGSGKSTIARVMAKERLGNTASVYVFNGEGWTDETAKTLRGTFNLARTCEEVPIIIINEVDRLKEKQFKLREFLEEYEQRLLVIMTTNLLANIDGSIVNRSEVYRVRGFEPQAAVQIAQRVLRQYNVAVNDNDLEAVFERSLVGDETELSLRAIGRTVDKLVLKFGTVPQPRKPKLTVV